MRSIVVDNIKYKLCCKRWIQLKCPISDEIQWTIIQYSIAVYFISSDYFSQLDLLHNQTKKNFKKNNEKRKKIACSKSRFMIKRRHTVNEPFFVVMKRKMYSNISKRLKEKNIYLAFSPLIIIE